MFFQLTVLGEQSRQDAIVRGLMPCALILRAISFSTFVRRSLRFFSLDGAEAELVACDRPASEAVASATSDDDGGADELLGAS